MEPLVAYLHYLAIVLLAGFLVAEMVVCRPPLHVPNPFFIAKMARKSRSSP